MTLMKATQEERAAVITEMVTNMWTAWNDDDYSRHSKDWSDEIKSKVDIENYRGQRVIISSLMGEFELAELLIQDRNPDCINSVWHIHGTGPKAPGVALFSFKETGNGVEFIRTQMVFPDPKQS